ncbi:MAG: hypothetical protein IPG87_19465 [Saprospiraceae bacterium]|nr:hypothetical protein [Candidatus Vicinibacter affinis]
MPSSPMNTTGMYFSFIQLPPLVSQFGIHLFLAIGFYGFCQIPLLSQKTTSQIELESKLIDAIKEEEIGNPEKAIVLLEKMRYEPEIKATVNYYLARLYEQSSRHEEALLAIQESVLADQGNKWFKVFKANLLEKTARYEQVAGVYEELIIIEPQNYTFYDLAAINYLKSGKSEKALTILDKAQLKFGPMPPLVLKKAEILKIQKKFKKATECLELSLKDYPNHKELYPSLIESYIAENRIQEKDSALVKLKSLDPNNPLVKLNSNNSPANMSGAELLKNINEQKISLDDAIKILIPHLQKLADGTDSLQEQTLLLPALRLTELYPKESKPAALVGDIYFHNNNLLKATEWYKKSVNQGSVPYPVWDNLIFGLLQLGHWNNLEKYANLALDQFPNNSYPYYALSMGQYHGNKLDESLGNAEHFLLINRKNEINKSLAHVILAKINLALKDEAKANFHWEAMRQINNQASGGELEYLVYCQKYGKKYSSDELDKAVSNETVPQYFRSYKLAEIQYLKKDYPAALTSINNALVFPQAHIPEILEFASRVFIGANNQTAAKKMLSEAAELSEAKAKYNELIQKIN